MNAFKNVIVVDFDGTLSNDSKRKHYLQTEPKNWDAYFDECDQDEPIQWVIDLICTLYAMGKIIVIATGRSVDVKEKSGIWLKKNHVPYHWLIMRKSGDKRHDIFIKPEMIEQFKNRIEFIIEDRNSVVKMWRDLGYNVLQCAYGDF